MPETEITVQELLQRIDTATAGMSTGNHHRRLLLQCAVAIRHLASNQPDTDQTTPSGIILPATRLTL